MKKVMRKTITTLGIILASVLYSVICLIRFNTFMGYRRVYSYYDFLFLFGNGLFVLFYTFGVYINAAIFRLFFKREREPVPLILAFAAFLSSAFMSIIVSSTTVDYTLKMDGESVEKRLQIWGLFLLIQIVLLNAASYLNLTTKENIGDFDVKIAFALLINFILVMGLSMLSFH